MVDQDDFEAWKAEPLTRLFLQALADYADDTRVQFQDSAWAGAYLNLQDQVWMAHLRGRSETAKFFSELTFEEFEGLFLEEE